MMKNRLKLHKNKGFTLVELIVVLVLLTILISLGIRGLLSWQDYSQFKKENTGAETIFYAVQNQFTEYGASGVFDEKVTDVVTNMNGHKIGDPDSQNFFDGSKIKYGSGSGDYYKWQPDGSANGIAIWANTPSNGVTDAKKKDYQGSIYFMSADKGDYDKYVAGTLDSSKADTKLLFDIITPYISDKAVLNGAILVEFSPEARQVFSVCYSDKADSFTYAGGSGKVVSVLKRDEATRHELMMGYYATESMSVPIVGRSKGKTIYAQLRNENVLELVIKPENFSSTAEYVIKLYKASKGGGIEKDNPLGYFSFKASSIKTSLDAAAKSPAEVVFTKNLEMKDVRIPIWKSGNDIHIVLDAADAEAQSYMYEDYKNNQAAGNDFVNTFSFYRFGFTTDEVSEIACGVKEKDGASEGISNIEGTVFASVSKEEGTKTYVIKNARHLYNVRFETDYKDDNDDRIFKLEADIDWQVFVGNKSDASSDGKNYYLTSYNTNDVTTKSGINFDGYDYSINRVESITTANKLDTSNYAFPGFRSLGVNDVFTGKKDDSEETYTISGLTITYSANMAYGVYGSSSIDIWNNNNISDYGKYPENPTTGSELHAAHKNANRGLYPLGLFAENSGTIEYLALNAHKVIGMELLKDIKNGNTETLVYTNMVGGFAGDNLGRLNHLKLRDVKDLTKEDLRKNEAGVTFVNGKTDVGGIFGRVSWTAYGANDLKEEKNPLTNLENYGKVTGMENVGGIVGKAYVLRDYAGDTVTKKYLNHYVERHSYYDDGYDIYGEYSDDGKYQDGSSKNIRGKVVSRLDYITIKDCKNRGEVSGDELIHDENTVYLYETLLTTSWNGDRLYETVNNADLSNTYYRCAFIGGIAGITMDGYYYDFNAGSTNWISQDSTFEENYNNNIRVKVQDCSSYRLYYGNDEEDDELDVLKSSLTDGNFDRDSDIYDMLVHDFYVGGLVGYARLTEFKNCGNAVDANDTVAGGDNGYYKAFVFGRAYTGGLFGCFDLSKISSDELIDGRYNAVNDTNVIGVMYAGGFAGGMGIGECSQQHLSYKHPSMNLGSVASQIAGYNTAWRISGIKNTAVVLGVRREALGYGDGSLVKLQDVKAFTETGFTKYYINLTYSNYDAGIGGIAGCTRMEAENCDNIQSLDTKNYALMLIGFENDFNTLKYIDYLNVSSLYGGNGVGGIFGYAQAYNGNNITVLNSNNNSYSKVDAVVFGEDVVGGVLGGSITENVPTINRGYLDNALVLGRNMVGGIAGKDAARINMTDGFSMNNFRVYGKNAVGGFSGLSYSNKSNVYIKGGEVEGIAFVGGVTGLYCNEQEIAGTIENVSVKAHFFAGGVAGAIYKESPDYNNIKLDKITIASSQVSVEATIARTEEFYGYGAFAGGFAGLYSFKHITDKNYSTDQRALYLWNDVATANNSIDLYRSPKRDSRLLGFASTLEGSTSNCAYIMDYYEDEDSAVNANIPADKNLTNLTFNNNAIPRKQKSVSAGVFAGGMFGYIPNNLRLTIDFNSLNSPITTPVTTYNVDASPISQTGYYPETIVQAEYGRGVLTYTGGIIGRNPNGLTIKNASYSGVIKNSSDAVFLGQITEVNAGTITSSKVMAGAEGSSKRKIMGGLTGYNTETGVVDGTNTFANGITLSGQTVFGGFIGDNRADMSLDSWNIDALSVNITVSDSEDSVIGLIAGYNYGKVDIKNSSIATGTFSGAEYAGAYFGMNINNIYNSSVINYIHGADDSGNSDYRTGISNDIYDTEKNMGISATLSVKNCDKSGIICGMNRGSIKDVCITRDCYISYDSDCEYVGAVCGAISHGFWTGEITEYRGLLSHCINFMNIGNDDSVVSKAGGIVGLIEGECNINLCDNHADIKGTDLAAGIIAEMSSEADPDTVSIDDCVNTGNITGGTSGNAGILAKGTADVTLCRNYGAAGYGITAGSARSVTKCVSIADSANAYNGAGSESKNYRIQQLDTGVAAIERSESFTIPVDSETWPVKLYVYKDVDDEYYLSYIDEDNLEIIAELSMGGFDPFDESADGFTRFRYLDDYFVGKLTTP